MRMFYMADADGFLCVCPPLQTSPIQFDVAIAPCKNLPKMAVPKECLE